MLFFYLGAFGLCFNRKESVMIDAWDVVCDDKFFIDLFIYIEN
jgi:hypothetical protein